MQVLQRFLIGTASNGVPERPSVFFTIRHKHRHAVNDPVGVSVAVVRQQPQLHGVTLRTCMNVFIAFFSFSPSRRLFASLHTRPSF